MREAREQTSGGGGGGKPLPDSILKKWDTLVDGGKKEKRNWDILMEKGKKGVEKRNKGDKKDAVGVKGEQSLSRAASSELLNHWDMLIHQGSNDKV